MIDRASDTLKDDLCALVAVPSELELCPTWVRALPVPCSGPASFLGAAFPSQPEHCRDAGRHSSPTASLPLPADVGWVEIRRAR
jgi:hypothetical protein